jgi:uncharacterized protein YegL
MPSLNNIGDEDLIRNKEQRSPCMLLLDTSASMRGTPIQELNDGLRLFGEDVKRDPLAAVRCEIAIITFGGTAKMVQDFVTADEFVAPSLDALGDTPMGVAINLSLDCLRRRKNSYRENGVNYTRPWMFIISDGAPTDDGWELAAQRLREEEQGKGVIVFPIGVQGADLKVLRELSTMNPPLWLLGLKFKEFFVWLSTSQQRVSSGKVGGQTQLPSTQGWSEVPT